MQTDVLMAAEQEEFPTQEDSASMESEVFIWAEWQNVAENKS
jgi:hypothetical protein